MITKDQIESHGLKPEEYKKIKELLGRDANFRNVHFWEQNFFSLTLKNVVNSPNTM